MQLLWARWETKEANTSRDLSGVAGWVFRRLRRWRSKCQQLEARQMHLVETLPLGGKRRLILVSCAGEQFLVGGGPESIETIVRVRSEEQQRISLRKSDGTCI